MRNSLYRIVAIVLTLTAFACGDDPLAPSPTERTRVIPRAVKGKPPRTPVSGEPR